MSNIKKTVSRVLESTEVDSLVTRAQVQKLVAELVAALATEETARMRTFNAEGHAKTAKRYLSMVSLGQSTPAEGLIAAAQVEATLAQTAYLESIVAVLDRKRIKKARKRRERRDAAAFQREIGRAELRPGGGMGSL